MTEFMEFVQELKDAPPEKEGATAAQQERM